jgi:membrane-bound ClpP family serine protease
VEAGCAVVEWLTVFLALADDLAIAIVVAATLIFLTVEGIMAPLPAALVGTASFIILSIIAYKSTVALLMKPKVGGGLVGKQGTALTELEPSGIVLVDGERWQAISHVWVKKGTRVVVLSSEGLKLTVVTANQTDDTR